MNFRYYQTSLEISAPLTLGNLVFHHTLGVGNRHEGESPDSGGRLVTGACPYGVSGYGTVTEVIIRRWVAWGKDTFSHRGSP
jgi:hypothetical protein